MDATTALAGLGDEVRSLVAGLGEASADPYDRARAARLGQIAGELDLLDGAGARLHRGPLGLVGPQVCADAAIFDGAGRLLLACRADSGQWCMPGGAAEVGEGPSAAAVREVREETGLVVAADALLGVFDNRSLSGGGGSRVHAYHLSFVCHVVGGALRTSHETTAFAWCTESDAIARRLFRGHVTKVPAAFRWYRERHPPLFH